MKTAEQYLDELDQHILTDGRDKVVVEDMMNKFAEQFKPTWISVKDRLPEIGETVVVVWDKGNGYPDRITSHMTHMNGNFDATNQKYWVIQHRVHPNQDEIKYWMPLPEPPKE